MLNRCRSFVSRRLGTKAALQLIVTLIAGAMVLLLPEIALAQFSISAQLTQIRFSQLPASSANGQMYYVVDAAPGTPCLGGGSGAVATAIGGVWSCGPLPGGTAAPKSVSCSDQATLVGTGSFTAGSNNNAGAFSSPNTATDVDNSTVTF